MVPYRKPYPYAVNTVGVGPARRRPQGGGFPEGGGRPDGASPHAGRTPRRASHSVKILGTGWKEKKTNSGVV